MSVPGDVDADVRLGQVEIGAAGFTRLHLPEVARLDIFAAGWRGMLRQEPQVPPEMGPPVGVVPYPVAVAWSLWRLKYRADNVSLGLRSALLSKGISEISRGGAGCAVAPPSTAPGCV